MKILSTQRNSEGVDLSKDEPNYDFDIACTEEEANEIAVWFKELGHQPLSEIYWCKPEFWRLGYGAEVRTPDPGKYKFMYSPFGLDRLYGKVVLNPTQAVAFTLTFGSQ